MNPFVIKISSNRLRSHYRPFLRSEGAVLTRARPLRALVTSEVVDDALLLSVDVWRWTSGRSFYVVGSDFDLYERERALASKCAADRADRAASLVFPSFRRWSLYRSYDFEHGLSVFPS